MSDVQVKDANRSRRDIGVIATICLLLQLAIMPHIPLGIGRANIACVFAGVIALQVGGRTGLISGFVAGLVFDLTTTGPIGLMAFLLTLLSYLLGQEERNRLLDEQTNSLIMFSIAACVVSLSYHLCMLMLGQAGSFFDAVFLRTLPSAVLTILCFLPFGFVLGRRGAVGGLGARGRHGGHYTLGGK